MNFFYYYYYFCETSLTLLSQNFIEKWQNRCEWQEGIQNYFYIYICAIAY